MRKMKKLAGYLILLAIPVAIAAALFIFNGSGYRLSEQDAADIAYKNAGVKLLRFLNQQFRNHVLGFTEVMRLVSQRQTTILSIRLTVSQDLF